MTRPALQTLTLPTWTLFGIIVVCGLVLRMMAATGGLWIDEAWSAVFAHEASPFLGVFSSIHHDNNHHLNTLWLQLVGVSAPPIVMRGLSIIAGTASIFVAARIGLRRGVATALVSAILFAATPILVLYGSEARGYAPMLLAALLAITWIDDWLQDPHSAPPADRLAIVAGIGTVAHLMMAPALALLGGWVWLVRLPKQGFAGATRDTARLFAPAGIVSGAILITLIGSAYVVAGGMTVGSHTPYNGALFVHAMGELAGLTTGIGGFGTVSSFALALAALVIMLVTLCGAAPLGHRAWLYMLLIFAMPLAVLLIQPGNTQFSRYYLLVALGLLLFASERIGASLTAPGLRRWLGTGILLIWTLGSLFQCAQLIENQRGHAERSVATMAALTPRKARIAIDNPRARAVLEVAAAQLGYALTILSGPCDKADYWFLERERGIGAFAHVQRCGDGWQLIAHADAIGPSGQSWSLYAPQSLQSRATVAKRPLPAR